MKPTRIYLTCESPDLYSVVESAQSIVVQKGCDPIHVPWPRHPLADSAKDQERAEYANELWVCQKQLRETLPTCDLFVAVVDNKYGSVRLESKYAREDVSPVHFELLEASSLKSQLRPLISVFARKGYFAPEVQKMLETVRPESVAQFTTDHEFLHLLSTALTEHQQKVIGEHLATLHRLKFTITCRDERALLQRLAQVVNDLDGNLAGGMQITRGTLAVLHFVGEWPAGGNPPEELITKNLMTVLPHGNDTKVETMDLGQGTPEIQSLVTFTMTFVDQVGIADHLFQRVNAQNHSVLHSQLETYVSGGMMLGRIQFTLGGDGLPPASLAPLADEFRKMPGMLNVEHSVRRGRFWT